MYTKEEESIKLVVKAFENKKRIKEDINLAVHSITVGYMLKDIGCDENTVISGFLHDIIEDTDYDYNYLKENYGEEIANNILIVSEDVTISDWHDRKIEFLKRFENSDINVLLIELADKLHNLVFDYNVYLKSGKEALATLNISYDMTKWYYLEFQKLFNKRIDKDNELLIRFNKICDIYFNE
ncbi:MAG: HD domain-containing protein [Bacilli bacterium]|nr:HD domain-containing protein [Bacilli bacterium]